MTEFKERGKTIVIVTHDLGTVQRWCDLAAWMDAGRIRAVGHPDHIASLYRQEVARAELRQAGPAKTVRLSPSGGVIPEPGQAVPEHGPKVDPDRRWGNYKLELEAVRLLDAQGQPTSVVDPEEPLDVCFDFRCKEPMEDVGFGIGIFREDGSQVFGTNSFVDGVALPKPLPATGTLRFRIQRLGLLDGNYALDVAAHSQSGVDYDFQRRLYSFSVRARLRDTGQFRPQHAWVLDAVPERKSATG